MCALALDTSCPWVLQALKCDAAHADHLGQDQLADRRYQPHSLVPDLSKPQPYNYGTS